MRRLIAASLVLTAFGVCGWTPSTLAEDLQFADKKITLAPPQGYCALDAMRPQEAQILDQQQKLQQLNSKLVLMFLPCPDLEKLRAGTGVDTLRYGTMLILEQQGEVRAIADMTRAQFVAAVAKPYPQLGLDMPRRLEEIGRSDANAFDANVLGALKQDENAVYLGLAIKGVRVGGTAVPVGIVGVTAVTLVNQLPVSLTLYQAKGSADVMMALLADQQRNVDALLAANAPAPAPSPAPSSSSAAPASTPPANPAPAISPGPVGAAIDMNSPAVQVAMIAGLAALVAVAAALMLRRRKRPDGAPREPIPPT